MDRRRRHAPRARCSRRSSTAATTGCRSPACAASSIEAPADLRDVVWMPAHFIFANGGEAVGADADPLSRLARRATTALHAGAQDRLARASRPAPVHGLGQRMLATDAGELPLMDVRKIVLDAPPRRRRRREAADGRADAAGAAAARAARPADRRRARTTGRSRATARVITQGAAARRRCCATWPGCSTPRSSAATPSSAAARTCAARCSTSACRRCPGETASDARRRSSSSAPSARRSSTSSRASWPTRCRCRRSTPASMLDHHNVDRASRSAASCGRSRCRSSCCCAPRSTSRPAQVEIRDLAAR